MENIFDKYFMYEIVDGKIVDINPNAINLMEESFLLFKSLFDTNYGSIYECENLISIHTGGWSENEELIREFKHTYWWTRNHKITASGGHYFFNTDRNADKEWEIVIKSPQPIAHY